MAALVLGYEVEVSALAVSGPEGWRRERRASEPVVGSSEERLALLC